VVRGGSWNNDNPDNFRGANRNNNDPTNRNDNNGFRVANTSKPEFGRSGAAGARMESPGRFLVRKGRIHKKGGAAGSLGRRLRRPVMGLGSRANDGAEMDAKQPRSQSSTMLESPYRIMIRHGHLFERIISFDNLVAAAKDAARGKRFKPAPALFQFGLESNLLQLQEELATRTYRPGPYHTFQIRDPKPRLISAAPYRDRVVHHAICRVVEPIFEREFIHDTYACRRGKGTHRALNRASRWCRQFRYALKCDVVKFFPSIDHEVLMLLLSRKIKCRDTLELLRIVIAGSNPQEQVHHYFPGDDLLTPLERRRGIPIGNLTSQFFGNVMLDPMDHFLKETKRCRGYVRYADDFLVFNDDKILLNDLLAELRAFLGRYRLQLHPRKCQVLRVRDGLPFLGWQLFPDHRRLRRGTGVRIQRGLKRLARAYSRGEVELSRVRASVASWIGFLRHGDAWGLMRKLLQDTPFVRPSESSNTPSHADNQH